MNSKDTEGASAPSTPADDALDRLDALRDSVVGVPQERMRQSDDDVATVRDHIRQQEEENQRLRGERDMNFYNMEAERQDRLAQIEANALAYLTDELYEDGREHASEITDSAAPDLLLARDVLALVEIAKAARWLAGWDFAATQWIDGLTHDGHELRAIHAEDVEALTRQVAVLRSALVRLDSEATEGDA